MITDRREYADLRALARQLLTLADEAEQMADLEPGPGLADDTNWEVAEAYEAFARGRYPDACRHAMAALHKLLPTLDPEVQGK